MISSSYICSADGSHYKRSEVGLVFIVSAVELAMETSRVKSVVRNQAEAKLNQLEHDEPAETMNQLQALKSKVNQLELILRSLLKRSIEEEDAQVIVDESLVLSLKQPKSLTQDLKKAEELSGLAFHENVRSTLLLRVPLQRRLRPPNWYQSKELLKTRSKPPVRSKKWWKSTTIYRRSVRMNSNYRGFTGENDEKYRVQNTLSFEQHLVYKS
ncbi:hypothetical protein F511_26842 [Dorcoceras hygrometricum]|uniref:Uncharacterized protein n=1 Tax=Dorcoceras hygrometricum TaxID=472368 RepID=A0A2Z7B7T1_9LAMI|nr:hypothetical protein F511_26842 [Dorcoceras hygrometricum]